MLLKKNSGGRVALGLTAVLGVILALQGVAFAGLTQWTNNFDSSGERSEWFTSNVAGFDGPGYDSLAVYRSAYYNGWVYADKSSTSVWNSINAGSISTGGWPTCNASAWIYASSTIISGDAKLDVWDNSCVGGTCTVLQNVLITAGSGSYVQYTTADFSAPASGELFFDVGIFNASTGSDQWLRIDDVVVSCFD